MLVLKHGGRVVRQDAPGAEDMRKKDDGVVTRQNLPEATPFAYLLDELKDKPGAHLPSEPQVVAQLNALGTAMVDNIAPPGGNSAIPGIYTYWGQFIDHDLSANTDRDSSTSDITRPDLAPIPPADVAERLQNLRRPNLDLDSLYGDGPRFMNPQTSDAALYDGPRMRLGRNHVEGIPGVRIPSDDDLTRDLPRFGVMLDEGVITMNEVPAELRDEPTMRTRAMIADSRNDENLLVAQFHTAVLRFHNRVVDQVQANPQSFGVQGQLNDRKLFERAQQLTRFHYQWLVANDFLKTVAIPAVVDELLQSGPKHYKALPGNRLFMPIEHAVASFRFGHSMVRGGYDHNRNFGKPVPGQSRPPLAGFASFDLLFLFTGNGHQINPTDPTKSVANPFLGAPTLPFNWIIEFDRFSRKDDPDPTHFARKIDTRLVPPIMNMVKEGTGSGIQDDANRSLRELLRHLARRNLLRGYLLSVPTGQAAAAAMGVAPLNADELRKDNSLAVNTALEQGGFIPSTPLWFYILKEAEVRANGDTLGELGSRLTAETIIGLLVNDKASFMNVNGGWDPSKGVKLPNGDEIRSIRDFLSFTGVPA